MSLNKFIEGWNEYVPTEDDNPDDINRYRTFSGLRRAWGDDFYQKYDYIWHKAACLCASFSTHEERYKVALNVLKEYADYARDAIEKAKKDGPRRSYYYEYDPEPQPPTEEDARRLFINLFRETFPKKRINSKFAKELWMQKRDTAMELCRQRYERKHAAWKERREKQEEAKRKAEQEHANFITKQNELIEMIENVLKNNSLNEVETNTKNI